MIILDKGSRTCYCTRCEIRRFLKLTVQHRFCIVFILFSLARGGGGHFNFICTGVCGHRIGKLTHPQTKPGQKTYPFSDYLP